MKAEELFPGALARVNRDGLCIKKDTIVEVRAVDADDKLIEKGLTGSAHCRPLDDDQFEGGIWCEYLEPIPITAEILEKIGFSRQGHDHYHLEFGDYGALASYPRFGGYTGIFFQYKGTDLRSEIRYVHQLQHALRFCGIEKNIEL